ncbi:MAG TPA: RuBisCO large subunit C-terminal-like domain-containing protein [Elusimicrobiota bacterium]|jgi:ribulose-bisphosphate carboxylase large chain|nr:RuBisCO large subunit C-terminal-like domain-containing protein [Elusimicrobiota bacterium]
MSDRVVAVYEVPGPAAEAEKLAAAIAFEETVEVPLDFPLPPFIREHVVGKTSLVQPVADGRFRVSVDFPAALASGRLGTLLNLVFGNASIWPGVKLVDIRFPDSFLKEFKGPNHGIEGLRRMLKVEGRPLLATALKPGGSSNAELAAAAAAFARGGGDIAKDDQNIVDASFDAFKSRVTAIAAAVFKENTRAKRLCLYLPHLAGPQQELEARLKFVLKLGLRGVLVCPAILGLDEVRRLASKHEALFMAHPSFSGALYADRSHGIETSLYLGTLTRLLGADIAVFPNSGGRFGFTPDECRAIAERARSPLGNLAPAWPAPGGGMRLDSAAAMAKDFGPDAIWLIGGSLLMQPGGPEAGARAFRAQIRASFGE